MESHLSEGSGSTQSHLTGLQVRKFYIQYKTNVMRRRYKPHPKWDTVEFWTKIGDLCLRINARPDLFVNAQFEEVKDRHGPFPNALGSEGAAKRYVRWLNKSRSAEEQRDMTSQMEVDVAEVTLELQRAVKACRECYPGQPMLLGYRAPRTNLPAWLRLLSAPNDADVIRLWGRQGQQELQASPRLQNQCAAAGLPVRAVMEMHIEK